jgi:hypothetical protein
MSLNNIFYITTLIILLYHWKPPFLFKPNGKLKEYGVGVDSEGYKKSVFNIHLIIIIAIIFLVTLTNNTKSF